MTRTSDYDRRLRLYERQSRYAVSPWPRSGPLLSPRRQFGRRVEDAHVRCPLCLDELPFGCLDRESPVSRKMGRWWTLEHAPPKSLLRTGRRSVGGRIALTCNRCNNNNKDESHASQAVTTTGRSQAELHDLFRTGVIVGSADWPLSNVRAGGHGVLGSAGRDIKAAYVMAFATLGYTYALTHDLNEIRAYINGLNPDLAVLGLARVFPDAVPDSPQIEHGSVIVLGGDIEAVGVAVPTDRVDLDYDSRFIVFLPRPGGSSVAHIQMKLDDPAMDISVVEHYGCPRSGSSQDAWHRWDQVVDEVKFLGGLRH